MHNSLLLISVAENKAYSQPTVNNSDSSPSFTFIPCVTNPGPKRDHFFSFLAHVGVYLQLCVKRKMCVCFMFNALFTNEWVLHFERLSSNPHGRIETLKQPNEWLCMQIVYMTVHMTIKVLKHNFKTPIYPSNQYFKDYTNRSISFMQRTHFFVYVSPSGKHVFSL